MALGTGIVALEVVLALISWLPDVRLHLIGWAIAPLLVIAPALVVTLVWAMVRSHAKEDVVEDDEDAPLPLVMWLGAAAYVLCIGSVAGSLWAGRTEPANNCMSEFIGDQYGLNCHGYRRLTDAAQFYNVRALHLRFVAGIAGAAALITTGRFAALSSAPGKPNG